MRFGKTFAAYQLAKRMGFKRVLVLTFKPAVVSAWQEDLNTHKDFEGWQFISRTTELTYETADQSRPIVCFGSFQDYLGVDKTTGTIKGRNEWVHTINWDLVIFDEYHFGAWKENAKKLFEQDDEDDYDSENMEQYRQNACLLCEKRIYRHKFQHMQSGTCKNWSRCSSFYRNYCKSRHAFS